MGLIRPTRKIVTLSVYQIVVVRVPNHKYFNQILSGPQISQFLENCKIVVPAKFYCKYLWLGSPPTNKIVTLSVIKIGVGAINLTLRGPQF